MERERYQKIKEIFNRAAEVEVAGREDFLKKYCSDAQILSEVRRMLRFADAEGDTLEKNAYQLIFNGDDAKLPEKIGEYRIIREIGRGGMGAVFEAVRETPSFTQRVALKVIKRGMDTDEILSRFRAEQKILSSLEHPFIARFLDGGMTADGLPFYAMEFVQGTDIGRFCRERNLSLHERLRLFRQVSAAVQYAHQNFIAHRDLKPNNILVTEEGTPKLLDFGIAKVLSADFPEKTGTATEMGMMTPAYASPEQIRGEKVGVQSDIYSLGVILYELLTGERPYKITGGSPAELEKAILLSEPVRPSLVVGSNARTPIGQSGLKTPAAAPESGAGVRNNIARHKSPIATPKSLRGDLDNIILKALRKEPARRYTTVEQFSEDLRRYLEGLPVTARADTLGYRASKFFQRNKAGVLTAIAIFAALILGIFATTYQARLAQAERRRAEKRFEQVRNLANNVVFKYHDAIADLPGSTAVREMLVKDALHYLDALAEESGGDLDLQRELALAYLKLADVQGKAYAANIGDTEGALASYRKSIALFENIVAAAPADLVATEHLIKAYDSLSLLMTRTGGSAESGDLLAKAVRLNEKLLEIFPENNGVRRQLVELQIRAGDLAGSLENNLQEHLKALPFAEELVRQAPADAEILRTFIRVNQRVGTDFKRLGVEAEKAGQTDRARELYRQALIYHRKMYEGTDRLYQLDPVKTTTHRYLALASINHGETLSKNGEFREAVSLLEKARTIIEETLRFDPKNSETRFDLAVLHETLGEIYRTAKEYENALEHYRRSMNLVEEIVRVDPKKLEAAVHFERCCGVVGVLHKTLGQPEKGQSCRQKVAEMLAARQNGP